MPYRPSLQDLFANRARNLSLTTARAPALAFSNGRVRKPLNLRIQTLWHNRPLVKTHESTKVRPPLARNPPAADIRLQCNHPPLSLSGSALALVLTVAVAKVQSLLVGMFGLAAATEPKKIKRKINHQWQSPKWRHLQAVRGLS